MPPYKLLEQKYATFVDSNYAVSCSSGTAALHLAHLALRIGKGDEVIVPDFTMAAVGFAVSYVGAKPVFVDCDDTLCIDPKLIEAKITKKTKAIIAVHTYGQLCDMKAILKIAKKHNLKVIEDACEAQGAVYKSKADITCYSFYENKIIHAEEGGVCTTDNKDYAERMNYLKNMAFGKKHDYFHKEIGYNYRMPNMQARLAIQSLKDYPKENKRRRKIEKEIYGRNWLDAVWVLPFLYSGECMRFVNQGMEYRSFFKPLSSMPMWKTKNAEKNAPKAYHYSRNGLYLKL